MSGLVSVERVILMVYDQVGNINKSKVGSFVHLICWSPMLESWVETNIVFMGTHYSLLQSPIQDNVMVGNEGEIIVTDEVGDFFKVITTLRTDDDVKLWGKNVKRRISNKNPMNYKELGIPETAYIAFIGAAVATL